MMQPRLFHAQVRRYLNPMADNRLIIKVRVRPKSAISCFLWYGGQGQRWSTVPMHPTACTYRSVYYQAAVKMQDTHVLYFFQIVEDENIYWFGGNGLHSGAKSRFQVAPFSFIWDAKEVFTVPGWVKEAVWYQIFPDRFCNGDPDNDPPGKQPWGEAPSRQNFFGGDLRGIIEKIPYLIDLGITAIWLNPIFSSFSNHKYDTVDYLTIDPHFGNTNLLRELVETLHKNGIRLILDAVFNHTSDRFWAFEDIIRHGPASPYYNWYFVHGYPVEEDPPNYACWWNFSDLPKLNVTNPETRQYLLGVAAYWTRMGIDGWRLDVPNELEPSFWVEFRRLVKSINPDVYIVGEIWRDGRPWLKGNQFDAVMNYLFRDTVLDYFARRKTSLKTLDYQLTLLRLRYPEQVSSALLNLLGSHDTARIITEFVNNPLSGEGAAAPFAQAISRLRPALILQMTYVGVPMVYYGDEVGMTGGPDPDCRRTMSWHPAEQDRYLFNLYRQLITIRRQFPALRSDFFQTVLTDDERNIYAFHRRENDQSIIVVLNCSSSSREVDLPLASAGIPPGSIFDDLLNGGTFCLKGTNLRIPDAGPNDGLILIRR